MALFVIIGVPLVAFLWETLNELLSGYFETGRVLIAVPILALFVAVLVVLARRVGRWETPDTRVVHPSSSPSPGDHD